MTGTQAAPLRSLRGTIRPLAMAGLAGVLVLGLAGCGHQDRPKADLAASRVTTIGVNSYLWRASLDALSFMPLVQTRLLLPVLVRRHGRLRSAIACRPRRHCGSRTWR